MAYAGRLASRKKDARPLSGRGARRTSSTDACALRPISVFHGVHRRPSLTSDSRSQELFRITTGAQSLAGAEYRAEKRRRESSPLVVQDGIRGARCDDWVCMAMHQCPRVAHGAINARYTPIKLRHFVSSSKLGLPMFYVEEDGKFGSDMSREAINSSDTSILNRAAAESRVLDTRSQPTTGGPQGLARETSSPWEKNGLGGFRVSRSKLIIV
jgi:hypothetical protein